MFFWKINSLKEHLINHGLSQKHLFVYIFIYTVLAELMYEAIYHMPIYEMNIYDYAQSISNIIIISLGTYIIYRANGGSNGKQFAERYFSIGFVIAIRFIILLFFVFLALSFIWFNDSSESELVTVWYEFIIYTGCIIGLYWRIVVHVKDVADKSTA